MFTLVVVGAVCLVVGAVIGLIAGIMSSPPTNGTGERLAWREEDDHY